MFINIQLCQCTDINLKFAFLWQSITKLIIQSMNSLDYQNIILLQLQEIAFILSCTCLKIKYRHFHTFSIQQCKHIFIKFLYINRFQTFEILFAKLIYRCEMTIYKIIIHSNRMWFHSMCRKLNRQSVRKCSLAR